MKVLIVDDSKVIHMAVGEMLVKEGHSFCSAYDGLEAIDLIKKSGDVDLILLDWNMPNMNGAEFLEASNKDNFTDAIIVMMTTENKMEKITKALSLGAEEYIMKPFNDEILNSKIKIVTSL